MRALVFSSLLLFCLNTTLTIFIMCGANMATEGLPIRRGERGVNSEDILAGADFLSVFMQSSMRRDYSETTSTTVTTTIIPDVAQHTFEENYVRPSSNSVTFAQPSTEGFSVSDRNPRVDSTNDITDGVVLAVSISSSVGKTINKELHESNPVAGITETKAVTVEPTTILDQSFAASEEHPSIVAKVSKSELNVEESEPITQERGLDFTEYPARVRPLPSKQHSVFDPTTTFLNQNLNSDGKQPFRQTLIYHNSPESPGRARSVSYSTVIQALPQLSEETEKPTQHERRERNYNGAQPYINHFASNDNNIKPNETHTEARNISYDTLNTRKPWQHTTKTAITTERNWETQEKPYVPPTQSPPQLPIVYGQPEQNYEVDESVSVVTNGRAHGVQPSLPPKPNLKVKKVDDNQKVGYVVEGRNYRKYRVEERTADGFIVGEYGVVSHDDGSLRGVRYTADGTINPRVISEALMKFLSL